MEVNFNVFHPRSTIPPYNRRLSIKLTIILDDALILPFIKGFTDYVVIISVNTFTTHLIFIFTITILISQVIKLSNNAQ